MTIIDNHRHEIVLVGVALLFVTCLAQSWDTVSACARLAGFVAGIACCVLGGEAMMRIGK